VNVFQTNMVLSRVPYKMYERYVERERLAAVARGDPVTVTVVTTTTTTITYPVGGPPILLADTETTDSSVPMRPRWVSPPDPEDEDDHDSEEEIQYFADRALRARAAPVPVLPVPVPAPEDHGAQAAPVPVPANHARWRFTIPCGPCAHQGPCPSSRPVPVEEEVPVPVLPAAPAQHAHTRALLTANAPVTMPVLPVDVFAANAPVPVPTPVPAPAQHGARAAPATVHGSKRPRRGPPYSEQVIFFTKGFTEGYCLLLFSEKAA
jgi:hypothetical protein